MWNGNNNNFHPHSQDNQSQQQQQQQQEALRRRLSLEMAAAAFVSQQNGNVNVNVNVSNNAGGLLGAATANFARQPAITADDHHLALALSARQQVLQHEALEEGLGGLLARQQAMQAQAEQLQTHAEQMQRMELLALRQRQQQMQAEQQQQQQQHQQQAALQELQRRTVGASPQIPVSAVVAAAAAGNPEEAAAPMEDAHGGGALDMSSNHSINSNSNSNSDQSNDSNNHDHDSGSGNHETINSNSNININIHYDSYSNDHHATEHMENGTLDDEAASDSNHSSPAQSRSPSPVRQQAPEDSPPTSPPSSPSPPPMPPIQAQPRGKPEAMAKKLASAVRRQKKLEELEAEKEQKKLKQRQQKQKQMRERIESLATNSAEVAPTPPSSKKRATPASKKKKPSETPKKKKTPAKTPAKAPAKAPARTPAKAPAKKKTPAKKTSKSPATNTSSTNSGSGSSGNTSRSPKIPTGTVTHNLYALNPKLPVPTMDDDVDAITETEYGKLEALMEQFCRVPLLAEFSRPVALLHPELMTAYTKIVEHPVDLGTVCRRIRRRQYENLRDVRLDAWRIFANCFKYHSHPSNKDAVPSFVSIALHLRDLFNDLWQEHLLPSDFPPPAPSSSGGRSKPQDQHAALRAAMEQRVECRKKRLVVSGLSVMAGKCLERAAEALSDLIENGGLVDPLDTKPVWGDDVLMDDDDEGDLEVVIENFRKLAANLRDIVANNEELGVDELESNVRKCYTEGDGLESMNATLRIRIASRMDRFLGQLVVPIHEATCRGVSQSSIWGCMAAAVWARESSKKPFWPALVLGIIAPADQKEDWHKFLTERNEARLPEKLKSQLLAGKRKAEQAVKRQSLGQADPQSFFLVEFLGSHEFIWVREADIVENFNPADDPNKKDSGHRSKKISRKSLANILGSKTYASAIEEAQWALEEFELQLQDIGGAVDDGDDDDEQEEEEGYSYSVLSQSDDEADDDDDPTMEDLDMDECNELLATNGLLDFSVAGRKRRAQILKLQKINAEKKQKNVKAKKARADKAKKAKDEKQKEKEKRQEKRDLEKKRRKRMRERERALKGDQHQKKKRKLSDPAPGRRHLIVSKRERAEAIVSGYVSRAARTGAYKPLGLGGDQRWIQSALIDSTNLSGMALAFRAAAGLIPMPKQDTGAPGKIVLMPWDKIRIKGKKTSAERSEGLLKQIELLEKEIKLRKASKARRQERMKGVVEAVAKIDASIFEDDKLARENPLKKSKKPHPLAGKKRKRSSTGDVNKTDTKKTNTNGGSKSKAGEDNKSQGIKVEDGASVQDVRVETETSVEVNEDVKAEFVDDSIEVKSENADDQSVF